LRCDMAAALVLDGMLTLEIDLLLPDIWRPSCAGLMKLPRIEAPLPSWKADPPPPPPPPGFPMTRFVLATNAELEYPRVHVTRTGSRCFTPADIDRPDRNIVP